MSLIVLIPVFTNGCKRKEKPYFFQTKSEIVGAEHQGLTKSGRISRSDGKLIQAPSHLSKNETSKEHKIFSSKRNTKGAKRDINLT